jgi:hypothetical protein
MIRRDVTVPGAEGLCFSVFGSSALAGGRTVLGHPFLRSVAAVFDVGNNQMHFAKKIKSGGK